jgi:hypothetical protein
LAEDHRHDRLSDLLARGLRLVRARPLLFAAVVGVSTATSLATDMLPKSATIWAPIPAGMLMLYLELLLTASALGLDAGRVAVMRYPAAFGLAFVSSLLTVIGILLLLIPGLVLLLRWSVSLPVLLAEDCGVYDSLERSWQLTRGRWWIIIGFQAFGLLVYVPLFLLIRFTAYPHAWPPLASFAMSLYFSLLGAFQWLLAVSLFRRLSGEDRRSDLPLIFS